MFMDFFICDTLGVLRFVYLIKVILNVIRFLVPIAIIVVLIRDLYKNIINPKDKDGLKSMTNRIIAAIVVFLIPNIVSLIFDFISVVFENDDYADYSVSSCYVNANMDCISNIKNYLNCNEISNEEEKAICQDFRRCNSYRLTDGNCYVSTLLDDINCSDNQDYEYSKYYESTYKYEK